jgi:16S rRNA (guanine527-N7)-methyltransferase
MVQASPEGSAWIGELATRYELPNTAAGALTCLFRSLVGDPQAPTAVRDPVKVAHDHLADSLVALDLPEVRRANRAVDIGAGAGLPGVPLAIALTHARFVLLESAARKCAFLTELVARCGLQNASVVHARAESWPAGLRSFDLATARAVAAMPVLLEYAAPLLKVGGVLVAWRGRRDLGAEEAAARAALELGLVSAGVLQVFPYPTAEHRHLHLWSKVRETPERFPRRPGMALKRPLAAV